jgi:hypothetical protein
MIRQIFAQPFVPGEIDQLQRRGMSFIAAPGFNQRDDPEIDFGEMRIGAKVIAHNHRTFSFQLGQCPIHLIFADVESPQPSQQLRRKARLLATNIENIDDGLPGAD